MGVRRRLINDCIMIKDLFTTLSILYLTLNL
jgi:hypothetical protein